MYIKFKYIVTGELMDDTHIVYGVWDVQEGIELIEKYRRELRDAIISTNEDENKTIRHYYRWGNEWKCDCKC